jgi:hypothetical protein
MISSRIESEEKRLKVAPSGSETSNERTMKQRTIPAGEEEHGRINGCRFFFTLVTRR